MLNQDFDAAASRLLTLPNNDPYLRLYQREANAAVEQAIGDGKRQMLDQNCKPQIAAGNTCCVFL